MMKLNNWSDKSLPNDMVDFDGSLSCLGTDLANDTYNMSDSFMQIFPGFKQDNLNGAKDSVSRFLSSFGSSEEYARLQNAQQGTTTGHLQQGTMNPMQSLPMLSSSMNNTGSSRDAESQLIYPSDWSNMMSSLSSQLQNSKTNQRFQYVLVAQTSVITKISDETLTYLNQGQAYEIKMKCIGDSFQDLLYKSVIRVVFHERRLQYIENEQMNYWRQTHPGERIIDIDIPLSYGLVELKIEPQHLNCVEFVWDPNKETGIFIKVHCISTEFTAKKHGGEKGVPFRIQIETYQALKNPEMIHCASCQIKVFKPKGADRKHKRDRDKLGTLSPTEKDKFQPSLDYSVLNEIPVEYGLQYLDKLKRNQREVDSQSKLPSVVDQNRHMTHDNDLTLMPQNNMQCSTESAKLLLNSIPLVQCGPGENLMFRSPIQPSHSGLQRSYSQKHLMEENNSLVLSPLFDSEQVIAWLNANRFNEYSGHFQNYTGADLLRLSREDLIQICDLANGIRLYNALQYKNIRPRLTIYICTEELPSSNALKKARSLVLDKYSTCEPTIRGSAAVGQSSLYGGYQSLSRAVSVGSMGMCSPFIASGIEGKTSNRTLPPQSTKRPFKSTDSVEDDSDFFAVKKRPRELQESPNEGVYNAVYLDQLTTQNLVERLASFYNVSSSQVVQIFVEGPSGIRVVVTDEFVANIADQSRYLAYLINDEEFTGWYQILLKSVDVQ